MMSTLLKIVRYFIGNSDVGHNEWELWRFASFDICNIYCLINKFMLLRKCSTNKNGSRNVADLRILVDGILYNKR